MKACILSLMAAAGVLGLVVQPAAAEPPGVAVTPAVLTIDSGGEFAGSDYAIHQVHSRRGFHHVPHHRSFRYHGFYAPVPVYPYPRHVYPYPRHVHPYHVHPHGGVFFHGPRVRIGVGW